MSDPGVALIKEFEGCKLKAYKCPAGVWTIGYGHTGPEVHEGQTITQQEAEVILENDLKKFIDGVDKLVTVELTSNQLGALVSFAFNVGLGNLKSSTLLKILNQGRYVDAAEQFLRWNKAGGKVLPGLTRRREAERLLFLKG